MVLLLHGDFAEGWRKYEYRYAVAGHDPPHPGLCVIDPGRIAGKRVLVCGEQGFGDVLQFCRYAPLVAARGAEVWLLVDPGLQQLLREVPGVAGVVALAADAPACDLATSMMSLPLAFGTTLETVPAAVPYLRPPPDRLSLWRQRLGPPRLPRIGLAWWGSQHDAKRSIPIAQLAVLLQRPGVEFHSMQKEMLPDQRDWLERHTGVVLHRHDDFADTAALLSLMDLTITIDTAVAHAAGALARPLWLMLPHNAEWRWLLDREDTPWYPTARLFRQPRRGDWDAVVAAVKGALRDWNPA